VLELSEYFTKKCCGKGMNMVNARFPEPFKHTHPPVWNTNEIIEAQLTTHKLKADTKNISDEKQLC
jgi:hypothetical protein